jgi:hypothetical protein
LLGCMILAFLAGDRRQNTKSCRDCRRQGKAHTSHTVMAAAA